MVDYSLYFHIPFCKKKCDYCHFYVIADREDQHSLLMKSLERHFFQTKSILPKKSPCSVYFGGGTPSLLSPASFEKILSWLSLDSSCEVTLEANPDGITFEKISAFKAAGINRLSIGVQSFDDALLKKIGRTHSAMEAYRAVKTAYSAGIENISIDLMYDLPMQDIESWEKSLQMALSLPLSHLSLYNLTIEPKTLFYKKQALISPQMPNADTSLKMIETATSLFEEAGFLRYEISAFSKPDKYSVHNTGYWQGRPFLGFGPSAFSYWDHSRFRNISQLNRYAKVLDLNEDPVEFRETLRIEEREKELLAIALRMKEGVFLSDWPPSLIKILEKLKEDTLIEQREERLCLTEKGKLFHDTVAERLFDYTHTAS